MVESDKIYPMYRDIILSNRIAEQFINNSNYVENPIIIQTIDHVCVSLLNTNRERTLSFFWGSVCPELRKKYSNNNFEISIWAKHNEKYYFCGCALGRNDDHGDYCSIDYIEKYNDIPDWIHGKLAYISFICLNSLAIISNRKNLRIYQPNPRFLNKIQSVLSNRPYTTGQDLHDSCQYIEFPAETLST